MAALTADNFGALQSLLKASSKDVVRQLCQESFSSSALGSKELLDITCSSLSVTQEEAEQLLQALHRLTRLAAFRDLSSAEAVLALFPANFHQNLKNLLLCPRGQADPTEQGPGSVAPCPEARASCRHRRSEMGADSLREAGAHPWIMQPLQGGEWE
uniref:COMM domain containing 9 n=1 Tax=Myotis myotis TaxID=51298 RepID=A0A7J7VGM3_MYOMY|nr:COMM domain containing 9 [Myotis myotis]